VQLTTDHISYIVKDLNYRGIVADGIQEELIDHVCSATEERMKKGERFIDAYRDVLKSFGHTQGLRETQFESLQSENHKTRIMLKNYFTIALRNLRKHSFYSFINILGLSVGVAVCMIIVLFVVNELSYDRHHENAHRIYRIQSEIIFGGNHWNMTYAPAPMAGTLPLELPEVEATVHFRERGSYLVKRETENIKEHNVIWAGKDFFKIFTVPLLEGNPEKALEEPNTMAISKRTAEKFFPGENAIGQTLMLDNQWNFKITGVYEDMPANSHFHFDLILSIEGLSEAKSPRWLSNNFQTYLLLRADADPKAVEEKLMKLVMSHVAPEITQIFGDEFTMESFRESGNKVEYNLQPLTDIHLKSDLLGEFEPNFSITYIYLFAAIASFILVIACINFMNLSTARSTNRAKEVGVRKVMGSFRSHLVRQFLTESILLSFFSFIIAIGIAYFLLPVFNGLAGRQLSIPFQSVPFYMLLVGGAVVTGLLAGVYPSFFLSAFKPANVLKGNVSLGMKSGLIRSSLVVFQFAISIVLIISTLAVFNQLNFIQTKKIGFDKNQVIMVEDAYALGNDRVAYKDEILRNSMIVSGTFSGFLPVSGTGRNDSPWWAEGKNPSEHENLVSIQNWAVDYDYIKTLGMTMKAGRDFSEDFPSDSSAVILNETAVKHFGFDGNPIGKKILTYTGDEQGVNTDKTESLTVIGVVENFHFESLKENIGSVMLYLSRRPQGLISFRFQSQDTKAVIELLESRWKAMAPGQPFTYSFLDERFGNMYAAETRLGKIFGIFASFAIIIACLGLFALTAFTAEQRTKEIGIRKVLGASVSSIVVLLSKEFTKLVLISFAVASPVAWWAINKWLEDYQYKVQISWTIYVLSGVVAFLIAWLTMSFQSIRAATSNPVNSLRSE
jgi:putative ABC transport system permease protein